MPEEASQVPSQQEHSQHSSRQDAKINSLRLRVKLLTFCLGIFILLALFLFSHTEFSNILPISQESAPEITQAPDSTQSVLITPQVTTKALENSVDQLNRIVYTKGSGGQDAWQNPEVWIMNPDGSNQRNLNLGRVRGSWKYPQSNHIFFFRSEDRDSLFVRDLATNETYEYTPFVHPDPLVTSGIGLHSIQNIAPDGSAIVFDVSFEKPCATPTPGGPTTVIFEGMEGCYPESVNHPNFPYGTYYYDLKKQQALFLGAESNISGWDEAARKLYFVRNAHSTSATLMSMDLSTYQLSTIEPSSSFGYWPYYLTKTPKRILMAGEADTAGGNSSSTVFVQTFENGAQVEDKKIDSGDWAEIQPFVAISPDESVFLYQKRVPGPYRLTGIPQYMLMKHNLRTGETTQLTALSQEASYAAKGVWVGNEIFITKVDTLEDPYYNINNYLVSINVRTGETKRLTPENNVLGLVDY